jgi:hypothetical protein
LSIENPNPFNPGFMKKLIIFILSGFLTQCLLAQAPGEINYQGVARNTTGNVIPNQNIKLRLTIHDGSASGGIVYRESRQLVTNLFGMFAFEGAKEAVPQLSSLNCTLNLTICSA